MRKIDESVAASLEQASWEAGSRARQSWTCREYSVSVETPLYGGGVHAGVVDTEQPIRVTGLRGQFRFWWRVACGPFATSEEMFQREATIWGGIGRHSARASQVRVRVASVSAVEPEAAFTYQNQHDGAMFRPNPTPAGWAEPVQYAVFPARGKLANNKRQIESPPHALVVKRIQFTLHVDLHPALSDAEHLEVETALRWWASFGGIGARTRRGLGAVHVAALDPVDNNTVAARGGRLALSGKMPNAHAAWAFAINKLQAFRQRADLGRNPSSRSKIPAGRSRWPEPDLIRRQTGRNSQEHPPAHPITTLTPRAAFGLPIIFHFKDRQTGDPDDQQLLPVLGHNDHPDPGGLRRGDRMASPLILRPYWDGQCWRACALLLPERWDAALAARTTLVEQNAPERPLSAHDVYAVWPSAEQAKAAEQIKPISGRGDDPLSAFLAWFNEG